MIAALWLAVPAAAIRPTEGGLFSFDATDVVESFEPDPRIRVHYSVSGPNETVLTDFDHNDIPDYAETAASVAVLALDLYAETGFRAPLTEADLGVGELGGSPALDVYLVDFDRQADGQYGTDACKSDPDSRCSGFLTIENDFSGYSYASTTVGLEVVISHELFHGVQFAYTADLEVWASEGTAAWAEQLYAPGSQDYLRFANAYLAEPGRGLSDPPVGPAPTFAYATGLWWDFLALRHGPSMLVDVLEAWQGQTELVGPMEQAIEGRGDTLHDAWVEFATWNLATSERAGEIDGYPYAADLFGLSPAITGDLIDDDPRLYPLATTYYRVHHLGGELWFGIDVEQPNVTFSLHPTIDGDKDSPVVAASSVFDGSDPTPRSIGDLPAGHYWLWAAQAQNGDASEKIDRLCLGSEAAVRDCFG
ncbi:MAG: MXAN_6640 family putative metalloprotease, partial [Myxococcota bacterium]